VTELSEDAIRLKFLAESMNEAIVHIAIRDDRRIVQLYTRPSDWAEVTMGNKFALDDLRLLIDQAMQQAKTKRCIPEGGFISHKNTNE
jgi:hypothetical protein